MKILVVTETDAFFGPMAAAFLRDYSPSFEVVSAGRNPLQSVSPMMVAAMQECLIDLSGYVPRNAKTVCASDVDAVYECPDSPCPQTMEECRALRDFIKNEAYLFFRKL